MCGIVGYIGEREAVPLLIQGLSRLEYRGYDSSGVAIASDHEVQALKKTGRLANLSEALSKDHLPGHKGIGHTRWATHGEPSDANSHPHLDGSRRIAVVHNGIIENFQDLRKELEAQGHSFLSETDTEVIPHLIEQALIDGAKDFSEAFRTALQRARGAYAIAAVSADDPDTLYAARLGSPLIIGMGEGEQFIASDVPAILGEVQQVIYLEDGQIGVLTREGVKLTALDGSPMPVNPSEVTITAEATGRAGFETYMLKEIHEQPRVLRSLLQKHIGRSGEVVMETGHMDESIFVGVERMMIVSCGTAYYASVYGKYLLEHLTSMAVETDLGSEFRYRNPKFDQKTLVVAVSQSGETADTLASIRMAKERGCRILSVCNVDGSSLVRESDAVFFTQAGPEIGVASTKAFTAQVMAFALLSIYIGQVRDEIDGATAAELLAELRSIPDALHYVLDRKEHIQSIAEKHQTGPSALYLGRRFNYPTALEGALKNKEISYQHAEGYAAGEMKHGPIALISEYMPVICICTRTTDELYEKMVSNMKEVEARHGRIIAVATDGDEQMPSLAEDIIFVPYTREEFSPMVNVVALQLLAYYAAQARGNDIDKPRNLAKSVTVE